MPRKSRKKSLLDTQKRPLLFLEPPLDGVQHHVVPQVRGALNPRSFVTEEQRENNTAFTSWVSPQFGHVQLTAAPVRRGRRFQTSGLDRSTQLSKKTSVCKKYPSLSFDKKSTAQSNQPNNACGKRAAESTVGGSRGFRETSHPVQMAVGLPGNETPKRRPSLRNRTAEGTRSGEKALGAATSTSGFEHCRLTSASHTAARHNNIPGCSSSTFDSANRRTPDTTNAFTLPDEEIPNLNPSSTSLPPSQPSTPPRQTPDTLVADTPEKDYGVKVTWRRRKRLMTLLISRGQLSSAEAQIII